MSISGSQLTRLGERLRSAPLSEADLRMLDEYRRSFGPASEQVLAILRETVDVPVTVRGAKSTQAIVEKLRRQSCRLGQIQDIAGCRLVVPGLPEQAAAVATILQRYPEAQVHDRRAAPSHGYRAVHLVVRGQDRWVEIQVRTELQHQWASLSELLADAWGMEVKYGGGPGEVQTFLSKVSATIDAYELADQTLAEIGESLLNLADSASPDADNETAAEGVDRASGLPDYQQIQLDRRTKRLKMQTLLNELAKELGQQLPS